MSLKKASEIVRLLLLSHVSLALLPGRREQIRTREQRRVQALARDES